MNESIQKMIEQADELYSQRQAIESVHRSIVLLNNLPHYETNWRLARSCFFLGQQIDDPDKAREFFVKGIIASQESIRLKEEGVEGHFWLGVNLALVAEGRSSLAELRSALTARRELQKAIAIDESYHAAGPWRVLARLNHKLPRPIGSKAAALCAYEKATKLAPENTVTKIYFSELLIETGKFERARRLLDSVIDASADPSWAFEIERDKKFAARLLLALAKSDHQTDVEAEQLL